MIFQESDDGDDSGRSNVKGELILPDREFLNIFGQRSHYVAAVLVEALDGLGVF